MSFAQVSPRSKAGIAEAAPGFLRFFSSCPSRNQPLKENQRELPLLGWCVPEDLAEEEWWQWHVGGVGLGWVGLGWARLGWDQLMAIVIK